MKVPKKFVLFGFGFGIRWGKSDPEADSSSAGRCVSSSGYIWVDENNSTKSEVLLHEVIHLINNRLHLDLKEKQVCSLGTALTEFIRLNPKVITYIATDYNCKRHKDD